MKKFLFLYAIILLLAIKISFAVPDDDKDGVPDAEDSCPNSLTDIVDQFGCSCEQKNCVSDNNPCTVDCGRDSLGRASCNVPNNAPCPKGQCSGGVCVTLPDSDSDSVPDIRDRCDNSQTDAVDEGGCSCAQKNCPADNNPCTDDCVIVDKIPTCRFVNNDNNRCPNGYCSAGVCVIPKLSKTCIDSDDELDYYTRGTVKGTGDEKYGDYEFTDTCPQTPPYKGRLFEYYCKQDGTFGLAEYPCPNDCKEGACLPPSRQIESASRREQLPVPQTPESFSPEIPTSYFAMLVNPQYSAASNKYSLFFDEKLGIDTKALANQMGNIVAYDKNSITLEFDAKNSNPFILTKRNNENITFTSFQGYIFELEEEPLIKRKKDLTEKAAINDKEIESMNRLNPLKYVYKAILTTPEDVPRKITNHKEKLREERRDVKESVMKMLEYSQENSITVNVIAGDISSFNVLAEYENVFNGFVLDIPEDALEEARKVKGVKNIYPNYEVHTTLMDSVPLIGADKVWKLDKDGNECSKSGKECLTGKGVTIAIIDTGVDYTHPDLGGCFGKNCKVIDGYDFVNDDNDPMDNHGHGTHVAATAAGNGILKGVAPDANIVAYKVLDSYGSGTFGGVISGIERAVDPNIDGDYSDHVDIISMSLGGPGNPDDAASKAVDNAVDAGVIVVVAAGNSGPWRSSISSPGTARKAITVGAVDKKEEIAYFSSRGPVLWGDEILVKPEVLAPGVDICAAQHDGWLSDRRCLDDKHIAISGTSMVTPHVAGAAALLAQAHNLTPEETKAVLMMSAKDIGLDVNDQGSGIIDVPKANSIELLAYPTFLDFGNIVELKPVQKPITITNLKNEEKKISAKTDCGKAVVTLVPDNFVLKPNSKMDIGLAIRVFPDTEGSVKCNLQISDGKDEYNVPYFFNLISEVKLLITSGEPARRDASGTELRSDIAIIDENLSRHVDFRFYPNYNLDAPSFRVPSGKYIVYAAGDVHGSSREYLLMKAVDVPRHGRVTVNLNMNDAKPVYIKARSLDGTNLLLHEWQKGFSTYNDEGCSITYNMVDSGYGDKIVYVSKNPSDRVNTDVFFKYIGVPSTVPALKGGWSRGFSLRLCTEDIENDK